MSEKEVGKRPQYPPPSFPCPSCPRCSSNNTKFCYYNNYSVSQPRYFCKDCRRYWTHGGSLRNIPTSRKRARTHDRLASSSSQFLKPQPSPTWSLGFPNNNPVSVGASLSIGCATFMPPITETMQSFNGGGCFNQAPFMFNPIGGVNTTTFGAVAIGFEGGIPSQPASSTPSLLPHLSPIDSDFRDFGFPFLRRPQNQPQPPPPPPPVTWTGQNMAHNTILTSPNNFVTIARDQIEAANVVNINDWSELNDMDIEAEPIQSYKPPSP